MSTRDLQTEFMTDPRWKLLIYRTGKDGQTQIELSQSYDDLKTLARERDRIHIVSAWARPGAFAWATKLELTYFPPGTVRNAKYDQRLVRWIDLLWLVISIPANTRKFAERMAGKCALRLVHRIPVVIGHGPGPEPFPLRGESVWVLESASSAAGPELSVLDPMDPVALASKDQEVIECLDMWTSYRASSKRN